MFWLDVNEILSDLDYICTKKKEFAYFDTERRIDEHF
jgi:hypothetical protein